MDRFSILWENGRFFSTFVLGLQAPENLFFFNYLLDIQRSYIYMIKWLYLQYCTWYIRAGKPEDTTNKSEGSH